MAETSIPRRGLVVTAPDAVTVTHVAEVDAPRFGTLRRAWAGPSSGRRGRQPSDHEERLLDDLIEAGFGRIDAVDFIGPANADRAGLGGASIEVELDQGDEAVVLVETEDGAYRWILPSDAPGRGGRGGLAGRRVFDLVVPAAAGAGGDAGRSIFSAIANFRSWVLRFIVVEAAARIDGVGPFGLVPIRAPDFGSWQVAPVTGLAARAGRPARILLAVHGTFSSSLGFAGLCGTPQGRHFLERAVGHYDAVLGFDHRTLGEAVQANAVGLVSALRAIAPPEGLVVDAIAHSRGGLVLRSAIETLVESPLRFDRVAFVGCPLLGTHLAAPGNWRALTDLYTTIAITAAKLSAGAPTFSAFAAGASVTVRLVGRFIQALATTAVTEAEVPGLASMNPDGELVKTLAGSATRRTGAHYAAVTSDFAPSVASLVKAPLETLKAIAADRIADDLFAGPNDLVVDTHSMSAVAPYVLAQDGDFSLGAESAVYHTIYFGQPIVAERLARWFHLPESDKPVRRMGGPEAHGAAPPPAVPPLGTRGPARGGAAFGPRTLRQTRSRIPPPPPDERSARMSGPEPTPPVPPSPIPTQPEAAPSKVDCSFSAAMAPTVAVGKVADLDVTISRKRIELVEEATRRAATAPVDPGAKLYLRIVAVNGCEILEGGATGTYRVPLEDAPIVHRAKVRGLLPGPARIIVDVRQGGRLIVSLPLEPTILEGDPTMLRVQATAGLSVAVPKGSPLVLRIYESSQQGARSLSFIADCDEPSINIDDRVDGIEISIDDFSNEIYSSIERFSPGRTPFARFEGDLRDLGLDLGRRLIPASITRAIFENIGDIKAIQVVSDSNRLPWELVHLANPDDRNDTFNLAEHGLVRWVQNCPWPGSRLRLDAVKVMRPDYDGTGGLEQLEGAKREVDALKSVFPNLELLAPTWDVACGLMRRPGAFDVFHFAGHGSADARQLASRVCIALGKTTDGQHDLLRDRTIANDFETAPEARPIVFLNACQAGRAGRSFVGLDGFASAFLRPTSKRGAAVFVSSLWSVNDLTASVFASTFYGQLKQGKQLVEAAKAARLASRQGGETTWLAYTIYGDPFARVSKAGSHQAT